MFFVDCGIGQKVQRNLLQFFVVPLNCQAQRFELQGMHSVLKMQFKEIFQLFGNFCDNIKHHIRFNVFIVHLVIFEK